MTSKIEKIAQLFEGIVIPARIRHQLGDDDYARLELMVFQRAADMGIPLTDDPDNRWGDQREDD